MKWYLSITSSIEVMAGTLLSITSDREVMAGPTLSITSDREVMAGILLSLTSSIDVMARNRSLLTCMNMYQSYPVNNTSFVI